MKVAKLFFALIFANRSLGDDFCRQKKEICLGEDEKILKLILSQKYQGVKIYVEIFSFSRFA